MPRKCKPQESSPYEAVRGSWEAASVAQFLNLFRCKFNFACYSPQALEKALVNTGSNLLADTCARLLRFLTGSADILISNFEEYLQADNLRDFNDPREFSFNSPEEKVTTLKRLVDLCLEKKGDELHDYLDNTHRPDDMRGLCAGQDAFNNVYWYLDDRRLYRECKIKKSSAKSNWECVCVTLNDWKTFLKQFRKSTNTRERALYKYLYLELFPLIRHQIEDELEIPENETLDLEEARDIAAMLKEGQQDKVNEGNNKDSSIINGGDDTENSSSSSQDNITNGESSTTPADETIPEEITIRDRCSDMLARRIANGLAEIVGGELAGNDREQGVNFPTNRLHELFPFYLENQRRLNGENVNQQPLGQSALINEHEPSGQPDPTNVRERADIDEAEAVIFNRVIRFNGTPPVALNLPVNENNQRTHRNNLHRAPLYPSDAALQLANELLRCQDARRRHSRATSNSMINVAHRRTSGHTIHYMPNRNIRNLGQVHRTFSGRTVHYHNRSQNPNARTVTMNDVNLGNRNQVNITENILDCYRPPNPNATATVTSGDITNDANLNNWGQFNQSTQAMNGNFRSLNPNATATVTSGDITNDANLNNWGQFSQSTQAMNGNFRSLNPNATATVTSGDLTNDANLNNWGQFNQSTNTLNGNFRRPNPNATATVTSGDLMNDVNLNNWDQVNQTANTFDYNSCPQETDTTAIATVADFLNSCNSDELANTDTVNNYYHPEIFNTTAAFAPSDMYNLELNAFDQSNENADSIQVNGQFQEEYASAIITSADMINDSNAYSIVSNNNLIEAAQSVQQNSGDTADMINPNNMINTTTIRNVVDTGSSIIVTATSHIIPENIDMINDSHLSNILPTALALEATSPTSDTVSPSGALLQSSENINLSPTSSSTDTIQEDLTGSSNTLTSSEVYDSQYEGQTIQQFFPSPIDTSNDLEIPQPLQFFRSGSTAELISAVLLDGSIMTNIPAPENNLQFFRPNSVATESYPNNIANDSHGNSLSNQFSQSSSIDTSYEIDNDTAGPIFHSHTNVSGIDNDDQVSSTMINSAELNNQFFRSNTNLITESEVSSSNNNQQLFLGNSTNEMNNHLHSIDNDQQLFQSNTTSELNDDEMDIPSEGNNTQQFFRLNAIPEINNKNFTITESTTNNAAIQLLRSNTKISLNIAENSNINIGSPTSMEVSQSSPTITSSNNILTLNLNTRLTLTFDASVSSFEQNSNFSETIIRNNGENQSTCDIVTSTVDLSTDNQITSDEIYNIDLPLISSPSSNILSASSNNQLEDICSMYTVPSLISPIQSPLSEIENENNKNNDTEVLPVNLIDGIELDEDLLPAELLRTNSYQDLNLISDFPESIISSKSSTDGDSADVQVVSNASSKTEENSNSNSEFASGSGVGQPQSAPPSNDSGQPLASNVLPKQTPAEAQYMQQQSQIFVFTTHLANKAAESVMNGQFQSIIACHCAQPGTKKVLEKYPLKMTQLSRHQQGSAQWLNNLSQRNPCQRKSSSPNGQFPNKPPSDMSSNNWSNQPIGGQGMKGCGSPMAQTSPVSSMHPSPMMGPSLTSPNPVPLSSAMGPQPSLMGVKVPDENLTPQQREHREEQLARIRKMQKMLFPEHHGSPNAPPQGNNMDMMPGYMMSPGPRMPHQQPPTSAVAAQMDWVKMQQHFYDERMKKKGGRSGQGPPPPPYTTRSASVPVLSPGTPSSPGTSNTGGIPSSTISLPSPRATSINSPGGFATPTQQQRCLPGDSPRGSINISNPGTPIPTSAAGPSPGHKDDFSPQQSSGDSMYGRVMQTFGHQKNQGAKEANLMPVPSPQQIQYLNTFEGQELTIQKQPNTSIRESDIISPTMPNSTGAMDNADQVSETPLTPSYTGPNTPGGFGTSPPHSADKCKNDNRFTPSSPSRFQANTPLVSSPGGSQDSGFKHQNFSSDSPPKLSPNSNSSFQPENIPLNPNTAGSNVSHKTSSHFDPITSMAQMSQQLANNGSPAPNNPGMMSMHPGGGYMQGMGQFPQGMHGMDAQPPPPPPHMAPQNYPPPHMCGPGSPQMMGGPPSPKSMMMMQPRSSPPVNQGQYPQQRMMINRPPYNGANVQVKASAPNTIQYLPARPQTSNPGPRGPPSLDFLQRLANPLSNLDNKVPSHNLQYFPNNNGPPNPNMGPMGPNSQMGGMPMNNPMGGPTNGQMMGPGMTMSCVRPQRPNMMRGGTMFQQNPVLPPPPQGPDQQVFGPNSGPNPSMFVPGAKGSPMGHAPDASQPLPPSMGQTTNYKSSPYIGPTTNDPNYAQQFHNFQQQLYATNTNRNNPAMNQNQLFFGPK